MKVKNVKKISKIILITLFLFGQKAFAQSSFKKLADLALENNADIVSAELSYESSSISEKTLEGIYAPSVSVKTGTTTDKDNNIFKKPDAFESSITYSQPIPGGFTLSTTGSYSFAKGVDNYSQQRVMQQTPGLSFTLSNSLYPYWLQGKIHDPSVLNLKQQNQYNYNQLLYTKKQVLQNLAQYYASTIISKKNIEIYQNTIDLYQQQIDALRQLHKAGNTNLAKITELENSKWSYQQDLISVLSTYESNIQAIKRLCGIEFDESVFDVKIDDFTDVYNYILSSTDNIQDPCEENYALKLEMLSNSRVAQKQNAAPSIALSVTPAWSLPVTLEDDYKDAWDDSEFASWTVGVGIDFSPLISAASKKLLKQGNLEIEAAEKSYDSYLAQKKFVGQQYDSLLKSYKEQAEIIGGLLEEGEKELVDMKKQYDVGAVSSLDYNSVDIRIKNARLSKEIIEINCWIYELLGKLN